MAPCGTVRRTVLHGHLRLHTAPYGTVRSVNGPLVCLRHARIFPNTVVDWIDLIFGEGITLGHINIVLGGQANRRP